MTTDQALLVGGIVGMAVGAVLMDYFWTMREEHLRSLVAFQERMRLQDELDRQGIKFKLPKEEP